MEELIHINNFCNECGFFGKDYKCTHTDCSDEESRCFTFSCPFGYEADLEDMKRLDPEFAETLTVGDWIVVERIDNERST